MTTKYKVRHKDTTFEIEFHTDKDAPVETAFRWVTGIPEPEERVGFEFEVEDQHAFRRFAVIEQLRAPEPLRRADGALYCQMIYMHSRAAENELIEAMRKANDTIFANTVRKPSKP